MYAGIYRVIDLSSGYRLIFDVSIREHPYRQERWELVAVIQIPDGAAFQAEADNSTTHYLAIRGEKFHAMDILLGRAGPLVVWHRANAKNAQ